ncbi:MAG: DUF4172 domain-containing protein [Bdellovibrio sp.]|nr:DUF4172 domain-containing protein [Bdellovibrio sp.]
MTQLIWQSPQWPAFSWQSSVLLELLVKVRFAHGKLLAFAPLIEAQRGDILLIDSLDRDLTKDRLVELFGEFRESNLRNSGPPAENLNAELKKFLAWFNEPPVGLDGVLRAGIAFFWFLVIYPFEENNEEIAREICELALAQDEKLAIRLYDLPAQLEANLGEYQKVLAQSFRGDSDITDFLIFFLDLLLKALGSAAEPAAQLLKVFQYWKNKTHLELNARQRQLIDFLLSKSDSSISNREYVEHYKISRESAKRDLKDLEKLNLITLGAGRGRSVTYTLK